VRHVTQPGSLELGGRDNSLSAGHLVIHCYPPDAPHPVRHVQEIVRDIKGCRRR
jgi:hypothetical protein